MTGALANHLLQSTAFAGGVALLTLAFRRNRAAVRYWLWLAASLKFLVPFSLLISLGDRLRDVLTAVQIALPNPSLAISQTVAQIAQPFSDAFDYAPAAARHGANWRLIALVAVWLCGFLSVALMRLRGWMRIRAALRTSTPLDVTAVVPARSTAEFMEPGVVGFFRPVLLLPEGIAERLAPAQLEAVLAHEQCHVRRRDNLTSALHMMVEATFWFHPLVWWIGARLVEERERACDEMVLSLGNRPCIYAEGILNVCKSYLESPLHCVSGVTGSNLKKRIRAILTGSLARELNLRRKIILAAASTMALGSPVFVGITGSSSADARPYAQDAAPAEHNYKFEVASIKPDKSGGDRLALNYSPDGFTAVNVTLRVLIRFAYGPIEENRIIGGPDWLGSEKYDIEAKVDGSVAAELEKLAPAQLRAARQQMLRSLLTDRFNLAVSHSTRELPVYALVVAKNGPKLHEAKTGDTYPNGFKGPGPNGTGLQVGGNGGPIIGQGVSMSMLASALSKQVGRIVLDQTGLRGNYDFTLQWVPDQGQSPVPTGAEESQQTDDVIRGAQTAGNSIFSAIEDRLGLKLDSQKSAIDVLLVDHVERPTGN